MSKWEEKRLGEVCSFISRGVAPQYVENGIEVVNQKCIRNNTVDLKLCRYTSFEHKITENRFVQYGDVLINSTGTGTLGRTAIFKNSNRRVTVDGHVTIVRANHKANGLYIGYLLFSNFTFLENLGCGSTNQLELSTKDIKRIKIQLPPLPAQRKIADILSAYDDLIENNNRRIELLEQEAQQLYKEWFVRFRFPGYETAHFTKGIPDGWEVVRLGSIVKINSKSIDNNYQFNYINYIDISSVEQGNILDKTHYAIEQAPGRAKRIITDGDVLWSMVRPNLRAYTIILNPEPNDIASTGFAVLTPIKVPFSFLYLHVTDNSFVEYLSNYARGAAYPAVTSAEFEFAKLLLPPSELLSDFHSHTESLFREARILKQQNQNLIKQRDLLLPRLMSGKLEV